MTESQTGQSPLIVNYISGGYTVTASHLSLSTTFLVGIPLLPVISHCQPHFWWVYRYCQLSLIVNHISGGYSATASYLSLSTTFLVGIPLLPVISHCQPHFWWVYRCCQSSLIVNHICGGYTVTASHLSLSTAFVVGVPLLSVTSHSQPLYWAIQLAILLTSSLSLSSCSELLWSHLKPPPYLKSPPVVLTSDLSRRSVSSLAGFMVGWYVNVCTIGRLAGW